MTLQEFIDSNRIDNITKEVTIGERFRDENGEMLKFKIRAMTQKELDAIRRRASYSGSGGRRVINESVMTSLCITENTLVPNFKDAASIEKSGCMTADEYLNKTLLAGEADKLMKEILLLSGFSKSFAELKDEAKK